MMSILLPPDITQHKLSNVIHTSNQTIIAIAAIIEIMIGPCFFADDTLNQ